MLDPSKPLANQRALVTGASSGIGAAIATAFANAGAWVAVDYLSDEASARHVVAAIESAGGRAIAVKGDVSREADVVAMFDHVRSVFGSLDILVSNSGVQKDAPFVDMTLDDWNVVIGVNLTGSFLCAREAAREFRRRGRVGDARALGKILCIGSVHDKIPWAGHANYVASKGGEALLMKTMAQELAQYGIRVNTLSPGAIKTPINENVWGTPEGEAKLLNLIPYGRIGDPIDVARAAVWLCSDDSDYVTGATLYIDGGMTLFPEFRFGG